MLVGEPLPLCFHLNAGKELMEPIKDGEIEELLGPQNFGSFINFLEGRVTDIFLVDADPVHPLTVDHDLLHVDVVLDLMV